MKTELDPEREHRITMKIIVDAYGPEEQAMGWYYYLKDTIDSRSLQFVVKVVPSRP